MAAAPTTVRPLKASTKPQTVDNPYQNMSIPTLKANNRGV